MTRISGISLLITVIAVLAACQQTSTNGINQNQKDILNLYTEKYLIEDYQYLYFKSVETKELYGSLEPPLKPEDFKLPQIALPPDSSQNELDTLFTNNELLSWTKQIAKYEQQEWDKNLFSEKVKIIREKEIPDYLQQTDIPPPGQDPVFIHYITPPFIYNGKSALLYSRRWSSGANVKSTYLYFLKEDNLWRLKYEDPLSPGY